MRLVNALIGLATLCANLSLAAERVPNTTLKLPPAPPAFGYTLLPAFPGLRFSTPMVLTSAPGETNRLFVAERPGRIYAITNLTATTKTLFLDISGRVNTGGEGGLLGLAFHPGYPTNGWFYVFYTLTTNTVSVEPSFHDRISRFQVSDTDPNSADPTTERPLITQADDASNHNAGDIHFGPDGYLYIATGDEGGANDQHRNSRRIDRDFFSAILRLDVDQRPGSLPPNPHPSVGSGYAIPPDNPFIGATNFNATPVNPDQVRTEFWAVGLRNPWRMSFDPATGQLYCGDVGQGLWEEVNLLARGGDYGWNYREGLHPFAPAGSPPDGLNFVDPIWEYPHSGPATERGQSITGGVVYRGTRLSQLYGHYVFADYVSGNVWSFHYDGMTATEFSRLTTASHIVEFGTDPSNHDVLLASLDGPIYRLAYAENPSGEPFPATLADTGAFSDLSTLTPAPGILPYDINAPFWSDQALKSRWFSVPDIDDQITFDPVIPWNSPAGTVWIKHFELELTNGVPDSRRRLETRFLVRTSTDSYGITYRWDEGQSNAFLVPETGMDETFLIQDGDATRQQTWHYPARTECAICHTPIAGHALSFTTLQLNRQAALDGLPTNQISALSQLGYFSNPPTSTDNLNAFAHVADSPATVGHRVRSYLAANCVQCHQPGGVARGDWDARFTVPLADSGILNGRLANDQGNPDNRVVAPGSVEHSELLRRIAEPGPGHMPPLATSLLNQPAIELLRNWISHDLPHLSISIASTSGGQLHLDLQGSADIPIQLQSSHDLEQWSPETNLLLDAQGTRLHPLTPFDSARQYYRLLLAPPQP